MTDKFKDKIAISSSMLGALLSGLDDFGIDRCNNILQDENVQNFIGKEELVNTAEHFFQNNLNVCQASKTGFMHRNTLIYRIDKIKKMLGLDIRRFEDAVTLHTILTIIKIEQDRAKRDKEN